MRWPAIGILEQPSAAPIPAAAAWVAATDGSTFTGTSQFYPAPPYGTVPDTVDCYFDIPNVQSITLGAGTAYVIPPGMGYAATGGVAVGLIELQVGTLGTWIAVTPSLAINTGAFYVSDGVNVRFRTTVTGAVTFYPIR